ncbi:GMC family oxidoreductase N-terminal domain-containing protein (plasmid) [Sinorhizobium meliloti]|nr:GMC family oxidoreductase N-terminal domain-containing protein [Sinorhizobium meliloti]
MLPLACERINETWVEWTGVDTILGSLADTGTIPAERFELRAEHLCEELWSNVLSPDDKDIVNTSIRNLKTGEVYAVIAKVVIVAANAFNTPQLLWKSGICPTSLGHYLNDQPMAFCQIVLSKELQAEIGTRWEAPDPSVDPVPIPVDDPIPNVWIPFSDPEHPYHCQIHRDAFAYSILPGNLGVDHRAIVGMRWFMRKEIRFEDYISFSDTNVDMFGMPQVTIHYSLSETDAATVHAGMKDMVRAAQAIGAFLPGVEPQILPRGSSCTSRAPTEWAKAPTPMIPYATPIRGCGVTEIFIWAANGILPTATACNPTLSSMALAIRSADKILEVHFPA